MMDLWVIKAATLKRKESVSLKLAESTPVLMGMLAKMMLSHSLARRNSGSYTSKYPSQRNGESLVLNLD